MSQPIVNRGLSTTPFPASGGPSADPAAGLPEDYQQRLDAAVTTSLRRSADASCPDAEPGAPSAPVPAPMPAPMPVPMDRLETVSTLQRNERLFDKPRSEEDLRRLADDPHTAPELGRALRTVLADEELKQGLDSASNGRIDGLIGRGDLRHLSESHELIRYNRRRAESFRHHYLASDNGDQVREQVREMTRSDAARELYKYSDYLPKATSLQTLRELVDGTLSMDRRPPQVIAAARYFVDRPGEWEQMTGRAEDEGIARARLADALGRNIQLRPEERRAVRTIERHADDFFDGRLFDREKLRRIADDPRQPRGHVEAARVLLADPVLFGLLDNAERGHKSNAWRSSDDGRIGRKDLRRFIERNDVDAGPRPQAPPRDEVLAAPGDPRDRAAVPDPAAVREMVDGRRNQPDTRTVKGGKLRGLVTGVMKGLSIFEKIGSTTLGAIAALKIPLVSQAAAVGSMVTNAIAGGLDVGRTAIDGGDVKRAAANAGKSFGSNALSVATAPGAGKAVTASTGVIAKTAAKAAVKETGKQLFNEVVKPKAEELAQRHLMPRPGDGPPPRAAPPAATPAKSPAAPPDEPLPPPT
ncbi:HrpF/NolX family T3SS translocon protein [Roseateles sp.]|uniref:HrpF/NolX family T3SS translocon protein n=1 Tax=Roseateles sp. TaxID=1971397 RepID=UPI0031DEDD35